MTINETKLMDMIKDSHIHCTNGSFEFHYGYDIVSIYKDSFTIMNTKMTLLNQRHDGHLFEWAKDQYVKQELKDYL